MTSKFSCLNKQNQKTFKSLMCPSILPYVREIGPVSFNAMTASKSVRMESTELTMTFKWLINCDNDCARCARASQMCSASSIGRGGSFSVPILSMVLFVSASGEVCLTRSNALQRVCLSSTYSRSVVPTFESPLFA